MDELDDPVLKLVDPPVDPVLEPACTFTDPPTVADAPDIRTMSPAEPAEANPVLITTVLASERTNILADVIFLLFMLVCVLRLVIHFLTLHIIC